MTDPLAMTGACVDAPSDPRHLVGDLLRCPKGEHAEHDLLSSEEVIALMQLVRTGTPTEVHTARSVLVEWNQGLVHSIARRYVGQGLEFEDLVQEGNIGLLKAIRRFDETRGYAFSTYATWWIRQGVSRSVQDKGRTIRIPAHRHGKLWRYQETYAQLASDNGSVPTIEELAEALQMTIEQIQALQRDALPALSLNYVLDGEEDGERELGDQLASSEAQVEEDASREDVVTRVRALVLQVLQPREAHILLARYGGTTLEALASEFKVTRERVRQIQEHAEDTLRQHPVARQLLEALG